LRRFSLHQSCILFPVVSRDRVLLEPLMVYQAIFSIQGLTLCPRQKMYSLVFIFNSLGKMFGEEHDLCTCWIWPWRPQWWWTTWFV
jgi:hypothetical protein